jgi:hypothetical protein
MKKCLKCNNEVRGRSDKKFCSNKCRNNYNNYTDYSLKLMRVTKARAIKNGIPFDLEYSDFVIPKLCPVFGTELIIGMGGRTNNSPSLDRKNKDIGYIKGNTWIVSDRVNRLKSNLSLEEMKVFLSILIKECESISK